VRGRRRLETNKAKIERLTNTITSLNKLVLAAEEKLEAVAEFVDNADRNAPRSPTWFRYSRMLRKIIAKEENK